MEQRITIITLGVRDLIESENFYSKIFGWEKAEQSNENIIFYTLNGFQLALYQVDKLAEDANTKYSDSGFKGFTLAYNTKTEKEVDLIFAELQEKGVGIVKKPEKTSWGGYSGYFADPDKNSWEIAYNPYLSINENGDVITDKKVSICIAGSSDLHKILELQKEAYRQEAEIYNNFNIQPLTQDIESLKLEWQNGIVLKAEKNGQIIGSARAKLVDNVCKIGKLIVKPDFQNRGIGKQLLQEIEKLFDNCSIYELFTGNKSEKNLTIYRKSGYQDCKEERFDENLKLICLRKQNDVIA